jgi:hypothetical protein
MSKEAFEDWYERLRVMMYDMESFEGLPLDPDDHASAADWRQLFDQCLTPEQAYLEMA